MWCLHTDIHTYMKSYMVYTLHIRSTSSGCQEWFVAVWVWVNEFFRLCARDAWVFMGVFLTSRSGSIDIWYLSQSEAHLIVGVWSDKGGGKPYIMNLNLKQRIRTNHPGKFEKTKLVYRHTTCAASWRPWPSSSSLLFCQCAGPWEVRALCLCFLEECWQAVRF